MKGKARFLFTTILEENGQYAHFQIEFWDSQWDHPHRLGLTLRWQTNKEDEASERDNARTANAWQDGWSDWYAMHIKADGENIEQWNKINKVIRQISRKWGEKQPQPADVLRQLARSLTFKEGAQDERTRTVTPLDKIPDLNLNRYIDNYDAYNNGGYTGGGCRFDCLARSEQEAQTKMAAQIASRGHDDVLIRFIEADKPVRRCGTAPLNLPQTGLTKLNQALL